MWRADIPPSRKADIDVDYASDRRQEIKDYLEERYNADGRQRVFSAGTFTTMKLKAALKDVARVHRVPHSIVNYITAMIDDGTDWTGLFRQAASNRKLRDFIQTYPLVIEDVQGLLGQPKAASIHASAIVVTPDTRDGRPAECFDFLPVRKMDGALVSEFDGYSVDEIGLLKEDVQRNLPNLVPSSRWSTGISGRNSPSGVSRRICWKTGRPTGCSRTVTRRMCSSSLHRALPGLSRMYSRSVSRT